MSTGVHLDDLRNAFYNRLGFLPDGKGRVAWTRAKKALIDNDVMGADSRYAWAKPRPMDIDLGSDGGNFGGFGDVTQDEF